MSAASNSEGRKRHDARLLASIESLEDEGKSSGYQEWAAARSTEACLSGEHDGCDGLAYDPDEHRVVACVCGCGHHERGAE